MIRRAKTTDLLHSHSLNILLKAVNDGDELSIPSAKKLNLTFCSTENEAWEISKIFYDIKEVTYIGIRRNGYSLVQRANLIDVPMRFGYLPSGLLRRSEVKGNWFQILNYNGVQYLGSKNSVNSLQRPIAYPRSALLRSTSVKLAFVRSRFISGLSFRHLFQASTPSLSLAKCSGFAVLRFSLSPFLNIYLGSGTRFYIHSTYSIVPIAPLVLKVRVSPAVQPEIVTV